LQIAHETGDFGRDFAGEEAGRAYRVRKAVARASMQVDSPAGRHEWLGAPSEQAGNYTGEHVT